MDSILGLGRSPGAGQGNPLQYSCLEKSMDRGPWQGIVHRVAKSETCLKWLSMHARISMLISRPWCCNTSHKYHCIIPCMWIYNDFSFLKKTLILKINKNVKLPTNRIPYWQNSQIPTLSCQLLPLVCQILTLNKVTPAKENYLHTTAESSVQSGTRIWVFYRDLPDCANLVTDGGRFSKRAQDRCQKCLSSRADNSR